MRARDERGWSLVEVLVVTLIIGLLAAIALPLLNGQRTKAKSRQAQDFLAQAGESVDQMWTERSSRNADYNTVGEVVAYVQKSIPTARVRDYAGGAAASTGANDVSVTLDSTAAPSRTSVTMCTKAKNGIVFCVRHDQSGGLMDGSASVPSSGVIAAVDGWLVPASSAKDTTTGNPRFVAFSNGTTEASARTALASRTSAGTDGTSGRRGWADAVDCGSCTPGVLVPVAAVADDGTVNDFDYSAPAAGTAPAGSPAVPASNRTVDFSSRPSDLTSGTGVSVTSGFLRATGSGDWWWLTDSFVVGDTELDADLFFPSGSNARDIANFSFYGVTSSGARGNPGSTSNALMFRLQSGGGDGGFFKVTNGDHSSITQTRNGSSGGPNVPDVARDVTYHLNVKIVGNLVTAKVTRPDNGTTFTTVTLDLAASGYLDSIHARQGYVGEKQDAAGSTEGHRWDNIKITGGL